MILTDWMRAHGHEVTAESVAAHLTRARANSPAGWTITPGEVAAMLPAIVAAKEVLSK
jgi:hypothetical protein